MSSDDPIGLVGHRMETMAGSIAAVIAEKDSLVDDQQHLLNAVAHEFRGPLSRLRFALDMSEDTDPESLKKNQEEMSEALDELNSLVTEVLHFGRLNIDPIEHTIRRANLMAVAHDAIKRCEKLPESKPIELATNQADAWLTVESHLLERALGNVLGNSCKYATSAVYLSWAIHSKQKQSDATAVIYIDDDGPGIPAKQRERVLQPFTRLDTSRTRATGGHGLGLAIVARIIGI